MFRKTKYLKNQNFEYLSHLHGFLKYLTFSTLSFIFSHKLAIKSKTNQNDLRKKLTVSGKIKRT